MAEIDELAVQALTGERSAMARLLSITELGDESSRHIQQRLAPQLGNAHVIGITGPPGAGKSTLVSALLVRTLAQYDRVAVIAVDPSSDVSKGALLGDRVRLRPDSHRPEVFFRSMASRGQQGGLAATTRASVNVFDACGWPLIMVETLGIGQVELDIMELADTVTVVLNPGWGDVFQANKAGLTEVGDVFVINKADRPGVEQTQSELVASLQLLNRPSDPPVFQTIAPEDDGIEELWSFIASTLTTNPKNRSQQRQYGLLRELAHQHLNADFGHFMERYGKEFSAAMSAGDEAACDRLLARFYTVQASKGT